MQIQWDLGKKERFQAAVSSFVPVHADRLNYGPKDSLTSKQAGTWQGLRARSLIPFFHQQGNFENFPHLQILQPHVQPPHPSSFNLRHLISSLPLLPLQMSWGQWHPHIHPHRSRQFLFFLAGKCTVSCKPAYKTGGEEDAESSRDRWISPGTGHTLLAQIFGPSPA